MALIEDRPTLANAWAAKSSQERAAAAAATFPRNPQ